MLTRRAVLTGTTLLLSGTARLVTGAEDSPVIAAPSAAGPSASTANAEAPSARDRLYETFTRMEADFLQRSPEHATSLGVDHGPHADARFRLDDRSLQALDSRRRASSNWVHALESIDRAALSVDDRLNCDVMLFIRRGQSTESEHFATTISEPYVVSQRTGAYQEIPEFLVAQHKIAAPSDVEAYLERLRAFAMVLDQETTRLRHDAAAGVVPPDFILDTTLSQLHALRNTRPDALEMVTSLSAKLHAVGITRDASGPASKIFSTHIAPALGRQIAALEALRSRAPHTPGVWQIPDGERYYQACLLRETTTEMSAREISTLGEERVATISHELDELLRATGRTQGTVGERLIALGKDPTLDYPNTPAGRARAFADATTLICDMERRLPQLVRTLPRHAVVVKRVPEAIEAGAALAFYDLGTLDGARSGIFYLNLNPDLQRTTWQLPTLAYHEAVPGHHLHASIQQESPTLPLIRKTTWFGAFNEGWSLYAEQLADEIGAYDGKPLARIGYLSYALERAVRLVVDTGLHAQRWTRERAIDYFRTTLGSPAGAAASEIDRYCASPAQACSYMIGKQTLLALRESARARLGTGFDVRDFHEQILRSGSVPLALLPGIVARYAGCRPSGDPVN